jgi:hemolysin activation/secretion protein
LLKPASRSARFARHVHRSALRLSILILLAAGAFVSVGPSAYAQQPGSVPAPIELRFDIARYDVVGNTLLAAEEVQRIVGPFAGKGRDFGDVQRALEALENAYRARGYAAVQVFLPEQDLEKGVVTLRVIEARIRQLTVRGNKFFSDANIRASLPSLAVGTTPNASDVAKNLRIVNESPAKQTSVTLRAAEREGEVDALAEVSDENPRKLFITLDNTGTGATGYHRLGFGWQHSNLFDRDHALTLQYVTSVEKPSRVGIYSAGYHLPLYRFGASMDFFAGYSDVDAGTTQTPAGALAFSGRGEVFGARFNQHLERIVGYDHKLVWGIDHRNYKNICTLGTFGAAGCGTAAASFRLTPVSVTYAGSWITATGQRSIQATLATNVGGGSDGDTTAIGRARTNAKANYTVLRLGASLAQLLPADWQLRARFDLQHTDEELVPPEQFGIGGANSVRGFLERERADDRGYSGSLEIYTPELAQRFGWKDWNLRLLGFYDFGAARRVNPLPGEQVDSGVSSAGAGLRLSRQKSFALRFDVARILNPEGTRVRHHWRSSFAAVLSF